MQDAVKNIVRNAFPELASRLHLPLLATVTAVPDPPREGGVCSFERPRYAVDVRLLMPDGLLDPDVPEICDVPVAMIAAAPRRGFAALPQPGTIVELAFAFGRPDKPFIRSVLPYQLDLPICDAQSQRWQQTGTAYQEASAMGDWRRITDQTITDQADGEILRESLSAKITDRANLEISRESLTAKITDRAALEYNAIAPKLWVGSAGDNFLQIVADFMATVIEALGTIAGHTHQETGVTTAPPGQSDSISAAQSAVSAEKGRLEIIKK